MKTDRYKRMKFLPDDIVAVTDRNDKTFYIDLRYNRHYMDKPVVMKFGQIEIPVSYTHLTLPTNSLV